MNEKVISLMKRSEEAIESSRILFDEEYYDACVSRAYYSMFYATEAVLLTKDLDFSSHKSVISHFGKYFVKEGIFPPKMGRDLNRVFEKRLAGDYSFTPQIGEKEAEKTLKSARDFIDNISDYIENRF